MATDTPEGEHYYLTLDEGDESRVLELVRVDGENYYIRNNNDWEQFDPDADNERVWDRVIVDVTPDAAQAFDNAEVTDGTRPLDAFTSYEIPDTDTEESAA